jgi:hypothetical protein
VKRRYWLPLMPAIASVVIGGGVASGYWSAPGDGSGSAGTGLSESVTLSPGQPVDDLFPGDTSDVAVIATNPNAYAVHIGTLELDPTAGDGGYGADGAHAACPVAVLTYAAQTAGWTVPAASGGIDGELSIDLTDALSMAVDGSGACQGAAFVVHLVPSP